MKKVIWTYDTLKSMYSCIVAEFGPRAEWEKQTSPGHGLDNKLEEFCVAFAQKVGAESPDAVKAQMRWPLNRVSFNGQKLDTTGYAMQMMKNLVAAYDAGFITSTDVPLFVLKSRYSDLLEDL